MAEDTICVPLSFFKDLEQKTQNLDELIEQLDILTYQIRQAQAHLNKVFIYPGPYL